MSAAAQALLDELEQEEEEEAKREADKEAAREDEGPGTEDAAAEEEPVPPTAAEKGKGREVDGVALTHEPAATPPAGDATPTIAGGGDARAPPKKAPAGFAAGFLNKKTKAKLAGQVPTPTANATAPNQPVTPAPAPSPLSPALVSASASAAAQSSRPSSPRHEPLHHVLPPPTPIYKPTPPSSEPASRAGSPRPPRKSVAFDSSVPEPVHKSPKPKRAPILLPAPPGMEGADAPAPTPPAPPAKSERPIKEAVVEREVKPPTAPRPRDNLTSGGANKKPRSKDKILNTMGFAPRADGQEPRGQIIEKSTRPPEPLPSASSSTQVQGETRTVSSTSAKLEASGPIHTLSLSAAAAAKPFSEHGTMSVYDIDDDEEQHDDDDGDDESDEEEDSDAFYGSDYSDDEEVDIDAALHAREIALEYHRQRMNVGAGAGTGPLGGFADPESYDAWNQPVSFWGWPASVVESAADSRRSRFRTSPSTRRSKAASPATATRRGSGPAGSSRPR